MGGVVEGKLKRLDSAEWVVYAPDRRATFVPVADVASIELTARPNTDPAAAAQRLDSLRRSLARTDDPAAAVRRYRQFIDAGADPATLDRAKQDSATWQGRVDHHLVRLGEQWVEPAVRQQAAADSLSAAAEARLLLKAGQFADARPIVTAALIMDPDDVSALYLQGLLQLQQNQPAAARASFEAVLAGVPGHVPTLVNLAVTGWQQGRYAAALARYDEAMILAPGDPAVLADVSAALAAVDALPASVRRNPVIGRLTARYQQQQQQLADHMTRLGLHPFGDAWLTDAQLADVRRGQATDVAQLNQLTADFERAQDRVRQTDLAIADVEDRRRRLTPVAPGPWLASYDGGPAPIDADLQNDADQLRQRRANEVVRLDALRRQATAIRRRLRGQAAGAPAQRAVGPEGTPARLSAG